MEIIEILKKGGIIAFPTDTVYGIGADAQNKIAVKKIYDLKGRDYRKPLILFIHDKKELGKYVKEIPAGAKRLIDEFWPGALTLIFKAKEECPIKAEDGTIGIRIPNNKEILKILKVYKNPLATTSANPSGEAPPRSAKEIKLKVDYVINGGKTKYNLPSTVLKVSEKPFKILRRGRVGVYEIVKISGEKVEYDGKLRILVVCTANKDRSPIAHYYLKEKYVKFLDVGSCGIMPITQGASQSAINAMKEIGIDISHHRTKKLDLELIEWADLIICMEEMHKDEILEMCSDVYRKIKVLNVPEPWDIRKTRDEIIEKLEKVIGELKNLGIWVIE